MAFPEYFVTPRMRAERLRLHHAEAVHRMHTNEQHMALIGGVRTEARAHMGFTRFVAVTHPANSASQQVLRKLDFVESGPIEREGQSLTLFTTRPKGRRLLRAFVTHGSS